MYLLGLGLLFLGLKTLGVEPVAAWSWWVVLSPLGLTVLWWAWADRSGYTKRKVMAREEARRQKRIDASRKAMGLPAQKKRR